MWCGVTEGLVLVKFSKSPRARGSYITNNINIVIVIIIPIKSLIDK